jgi:hypothetical protein
MIRKQTLLALCIALALLAGVATTTAGAGNPQDPNACKKGGWQTLLKADGKGFKNEDACVRYFLGGGNPNRSSQQLCQSYGGTFGADDQTGFSLGTVFWTCNGNGVTFAAFTQLTTACQVDLGSQFAGSAWALTGTQGVSAFTCFRAP